MFWKIVFQKVEIISRKVYSNFFFSHKYLVFSYKPFTMAYLEVDQATLEESKTIIKVVKK